MVVVIFLIPSVAPVMLQALNKPFKPQASPARTRLRRAA
jgi:hypothetical protein